MKISKLVVVATVCSTLSACSVEEMAAVNKKISDGAFAVTKALNGGTGYADNLTSNCRRSRINAKMLLMSLLMWIPQQAD